MTFPDPVGWPDTPARPRDDTFDASFELPPLPTLSPLPVVKPLEPMPRPPWEADTSTTGGDPGATRAASASPAPPPPPSGHPAAEPPAPSWTVPAAWPTATQPSAATPADLWSAPTLSSNPTSPAERWAPRPASEPWMTQPTAADHPAPEAPEAAPDSASPTEHRTWTQTPETAPAASDPIGPADPQPIVGRHAGADVSPRTESLPLAPGLKVVMVGGSEPLGTMIAERLILAGHRLAVHGVALPTELQQDVDTRTFRLAEPLSLPGDRADAEEMVHAVARAEVALGGLDAIVVLPAQQATSTTLDADAATWADEWSMALTTEVLAAACAAHIAARSFLARRRAGRIVLVTNGRDGALSGAMPTAATRAALSRLGADLTRELSPHGIGVSVVTTGPGGAQDFAMTQVADVVEALLATPVLSGVSARIG